MPIIAFQLPFEHAQDIFEKVQDGSLDPTINPGGSLVTLRGYAVIPYSYPASTARTLGGVFDDAALNPGNTHIVTLTIDSNHSLPPGAFSAIQNAFLANLFFSIPNFIIRYVVL